MRNVRMDNMIRSVCEWIKLSIDYHIKLPVKDKRDLFVGMMMLGNNTSLLNKNISKCLKITMNVRARERPYLLSATICGRGTTVFKSTVSELPWLEQGHQQLLWSMYVRVWSLREVRFVPNMVWLRVWHAGQGSTRKPAVWWHQWWVQVGHSAWIGGEFDRLSRRLYDPLHVCTLG